MLNAAFSKERDRQTAAADLAGSAFFEPNGRKGGVVYNFFAAIAEKILLSAVNYLTAGGWYILILSVKLYRYGVLPWKRGGERK